MAASPSPAPIAAAAEPSNSMPTASLETIPDELRSKLLIDFVGKDDIPSLIQLASSSKNLQSAVYRDTPALWTTLDFGRLEKEVKERLTDKPLETLLSKVNAGKVTTDLILYGCNGVTGTGIKPLRGSTVLESIDLRFWEGECRSNCRLPHYEVISGVIRSMSPFVAYKKEGGIKVLKLDYVRQVYPGGRPYNPRTGEAGERELTEDEKLHNMISKSMSNLEYAFCGALAARMKERGTACDCCSKSMYERMVTSSNDKYSETEFYECTAAWSICFSCKGAFCGEGGCRKTQFCFTCCERECTGCSTMSTCGKYACLGLDAGYF
mmetsp:Transcript_37822/g.76967  ORF Transcript_37822/g.76967 Transcript_37822/m.76967 type:complete len:323 (+) Transcript_37822:269-1237(+)